MSQLCFVHIRAPSLPAARKLPAQWLPYYLESTRYEEPEHISAFAKVAWNYLRPVWLCLLRGRAKGVLSRVYLDLKSLDTVD